LNTAEIALASCDFIDKVQYINYIKDLPSEISRNAAISLYFHKYGFFIIIDEALSILLQAKLFYRAIKLNIKLYRWEKALDLALTYTHTCIYSYTHTYVYVNMYACV
jgi:intraflagellar transport protein 80